MAARSSRGAAALVTVMLSAGLLGALAGGEAPKAQATAVALEVPEGRYLEVGAPLSLVGETNLQTVPEPFIDSGGGLVVSYLSGAFMAWSSSKLQRFDGKTGTPVGLEVDVAPGLQNDPWGPTTARGSYAALGGTDRLARVYWAYAFPNPVVNVRVVDLSGTTLVADRRMGPTPAGSPAGAVAVGANGSLHLLRWNASLQYSRMAANGSWTGANLTLYGDGATGFPGQLVYDKPAGLMVAAWASRTGIGYVRALHENGTAAWGPLNLGTTAASLSVAAMADGGVVAVWTDGSDVHAVKINASGSVDLADRVVFAGESAPQAPRPLCLPSGEVLLVWSVGTVGGPMTVRAAAVLASDLSVAAQPVSVSAGTNSDVNARAALAPDGSVWVVWQNETATPTSTIWGALLRVRWTGFRLASEAIDLTLVRGETGKVALTITSLSPEAGNLSIAAVAAASAPPTNWTARVVDATSGLPVALAGLSAGEARGLSLEVLGPVADPAPYGALVRVQVADVGRPSVVLELRVNVTVVVGHRFQVDPADQNVTAWPGLPANVSFTVKNTGLADESGVPMVVSASPSDPSWSVALWPAAFAGAPGSSQTVQLQVTPGPDAKAGTSYCARLRVQNPNDVFSLATAGFCVRVGLVAVPEVTPQFQAAEVDSGGSTRLAFALLNEGNAALPIDCTLGLVETLTGGWTVLGSPFVAKLAGGQTANISFEVAAPGNALGGSLVNLTVRGTCAGSASVGEARVGISVRNVHSGAWRSQGNSADADASGAASFEFTLENTGNVPEQAGAVVLEAPAMFVVQSATTVAGVASTEVPAFGQGRVTLRVQAPVEARAGSYQLSVSLRAGALDPVNLLLTVRLPPIYGLQAAFNASGLDVGPSGAVVIVAELRHLANVADTFVVTVRAEAPQYWSVAMRYEAGGANDSSALISGTLTLSPFARGRLVLTLTAPREPLPVNVPITVLLSSARGPTASYGEVARVVLPDLTVAFETLPPGRADPELRGEVVLRVGNAGQAESAPTHLRLTLDGVVIAEVNLTAVAAEMSVLVRLPVALWPGAHTLSALVDPKDQPGASPVVGWVYESDEHNNAAVATFSIEGPAPTAPARESGPVTTSPVGPTALLAIVPVLAGVGAAAFLLVRQRRKHPKE